MWVKAKFGKKAKFAEKVGADPTLLSRWLGGKGISDEYKAKIRKLGYEGPWPNEVDVSAVFEEPAPYVTGVSPSSIEEAWLLLHKTAHAAGVDLMTEEDQKEVGEAIATIAEGYAQQRGPEGELRLARLAEKLVRALGKGSP